MRRRTETTLTFKVKLKMPTGSNANYTADYVREAVKVYCGGRDPQDCMFDLDPDTVTVSLLKKETSYA